MKGIKIRNAVLRTLAGGVVLTATIAVIIGVIVIFLYGIGQFARPLCGKLFPLVYAKGFGFWRSCGVGYVGLYFTAATILLLSIVFFGVYKGSRWTGERLFNSLAAHSK